MISNTTGRLLKIHINAFLQKKYVFPCVGDFTLIYGPYRCLEDGLFWPYFDEQFCLFFKCSLNFQAHALQFKLNKVGYTDFAEFQLQSMCSKIERAFEKTNKPCFCLHFSNSNLIYFFLHFLFNYFFFIFHTLHLH